MTTPPGYPPRPNTPAEPEVWSMPTIQHPAVVPPQSPHPSPHPSQPPQRAQRRGTGAPVSRSTDKPQPWAWENSEDALSEDDIASVAIPPRRPMRRRDWGRMALALALGLVVGGILVGIAAMAGLLPAPRGNTSSGNNAAVSTPPPSSSIVYVVLQIKGDSFSAVDANNHAVVIHTTTATTYQREGIPANFKDIGAGTRMTIRGKVANDDSIYANRIAILDPGFSGTIATINGNTLSVSTRGAAATQTTPVMITSGTMILDAKTRQTVKPGDLIAGHSVQVYGEMDPTGQFSAFLILINE